MSSSSGPGKRKNSSLGLASDMSGVAEAVEELTDLGNDLDLDIDLDLDLQEADDLVTELVAPGRVGERTSSVSEENSSDNLLEYDSVSSPGGSSTASGPTYIRQAGFEHHAHEVVQATPNAQGQQKEKEDGKRATLTSSLTSGHQGHQRPTGAVLSRHSFSSATPLKVGGAVTSSLGAKKKKKNGLLSSDLSLAASGKKKIEGVAVGAGMGVATSRTKSRKGKNVIF